MRGRKKNEKISRYDFSPSDGTTLTPSLSSPSLPSSLAHKGSVGCLLDRNVVKILRNIRSLMFPSHFSKVDSNQGFLGAFHFNCYFAIPFRPRRIEYPVCVKKTRNPDQLADKPDILKETGAIHNAPRK